MGLTYTHYNTTSKVRSGGRAELPYIQGQDWRPRGDTPYPTSGGADVRRYPTFKVRSSHEEIPHAQGKRNPSKMVGVARGHQRADTLTILTEN